MAYLGQTFSTDSLPQSQSFEPVPEGWYEVTISTASLDQTKDKLGEFIRIRFDITWPTHQGKVIFTNLNIRNPNVQAEEIGRQQLGDIMRAIGLPHISDTDQLIGGNLKIKVVVRPATEKYSAQNEVKAYNTSDGTAPTASAAKSDDTRVSPPWSR